MFQRQISKLSGPAEPVGQVGQTPDQYFGVALYYSFTFHYHTPKVMKFIPHMWAGKSFQSILIRLPNQYFFDSAGPGCMCTLHMYGRVSRGDNITVLYAEVFCCWVVGLVRVCCNVVAYLSDKTIMQVE